MNKSYVLSSTFKGLDFFFFFFFKMPSTISSSGRPVEDVYRLAKSKYGLLPTCFLHCGHVLVEPIWNHCTRLEKIIHNKGTNSNTTEVHASQLLCLKWGYHSWWKVCPQWMAATSLQWSKMSEQIVHCARIGIFWSCRICPLHKRIVQTFQK